MRGLRARLEGRVIVRAMVHRPDLRWALPPGLAERLTGARVESFRRRAKYILMRLSGGDSVLLHLGMSGRMVLGPLTAEQRHARTSMSCSRPMMAGGSGFVDPRRFGSMDLVPTAREEEHRLLAGLGPEPLDEAFSTGVLARRIGGQAHAGQSGAAGPAGGGWAGQHLRVRGAVPRPHRTGPPGRHGPTRRCRAAGESDQGDIERRRSLPGAPRCGITCSRTASLDTSSTPGRYMAGKASPASVAPVRRSARAWTVWCSRPGRRSIVQGPSGRLAGRRPRAISPLV